MRPLIFYFFLLLKGVNMSIWKIEIDGNPENTSLL